ncbi:GNAT family N-acetyltransferase [Sporomusa aerivorans]|uniref:GNAT family N-acetyltransferase n=1 Tax=Sporomusa aerivorans TaxID=204936 RepID=UPI00352AD97A
MEIKMINAADTWELRQKILRPDKPLQYIQLPDDAAGTHYGLYEGDRLLAVISTFMDRGEIQFRKFATVQDKQGQGYGTKLLRHVMAAAQMSGATAIWCNARKDKVSFYEKFGLETTPVENERDGIKYIIMRKQLVGKTINNRLEQQICFLVEVDKLKTIYRKNYVIGTDRRETDAEHSWHLAVMAMLLAEYVDDYPIDVFKVVKMLLIHDIVEIDAGDTYCFDQQAGVDKDVREQAAAGRLFGLLPADQSQELRDLWEEFEQKQSPEARLADALDRLQPLLLHYHTGGKSWQENGITSDKVRERNKRTKDIAIELGQLVEQVIQDSIARGYLRK